MAINQSQYVRRVLLPALLLVLISARAAPAQKTADRSAPPTSVSSSIEQLRSPELQQRRDAARELAKVAPMPPEVIEALARFLETAEKNDASQRYAILGLAETGSPAVPAVARLLNSHNPVTREAACEVLGRMAPSAPASWPILIAYFTRARPNAWGVAYELARAGPPVVPLLRQALRDKDSRTRMGAAATLAEMADFA
jgi:HEAT repeat protein